MSHGRLVLIVHCATALEHIFQHCNTTEMDSAVAYFYCDFNAYDKQQSSNLLRSLLQQLSLRNVSCFDELRRQWQQRRRGQHVISSELVAKLLDAAIAQRQHVYLVLDALDECSDREALLKSLRCILSRHKTRLHLLATTRECDISQRLAEDVTHSVNLDTAQVDDDIRAYVGHHLRTGERYQKWGEGTRQLIHDTLVEKANGM